jgi:hypothetical protein
MNLVTIRSVLLCCTLINFGILALWAILMLLPHDWLRRLWVRHVSAEQFDAINFGGIVLYKMLILVFNLVPYLALLIAA